MAIEDVERPAEDAVFTDPGKIAEVAERIYDERYRAEFEASHCGEFVAIDVQDGRAYKGQHAELALQRAREQAPYGIFHLIRIGARGAFRASYGRQSTSWNWTLRRAR